MATTNYDGPEQTIVEYPSHSGAATAHVAYMKFMAQQADANVAIPIRNKTDEMHNIGGLQLVCIPNHEATGFTQGHNLQTHGRPLIIGQAGGLPHGLPAGYEKTGYWELASEEERTALKLQYASRNVQCFGMAMDSFRFQPGPDQTPTVDGLRVIMHGPGTMTLYTPVPLRPLSDLVLSLIPQQGAGRSGSVRYQSDGPERSPFTLKEHSPETTCMWARDAINAFSLKLDKKNVKWLFAAKEDVFSTRRPMRESEANGGKLVLGILSTSLAVIQVLIAEKKLAVVSGEKWEEYGPKVLGLTQTSELTGDTTPEAAIKIIKAIISTINNNNRNANPDKRHYASLVASSVQTLFNGFSGVTQSCGTIIARLLGANPQAYGKGNSGMHEYNVFMKTA